MGGDGLEGVWTADAIDTGLPEGEPEATFFRNDKLTYAILWGSGHHVAFQKPRASQLFVTDWIYGFGDSLAETAATKQEYTTAAYVIGTVAGLCVLTGFFFWCGWCPNPKWYNED